MANNIPFEFQRNSPHERRCGVAALAMIYCWLGFSADQDCLWQEIGQYSSQHPNFLPLPKLKRIYTFHLARNALEHGLAAVPCRLNDPWKSLEQCFTHKIGVILNHRITLDSAKGHYTVLTDFDAAAETVYLHDPQFGANRCISKTELLELWQPKFPDCEITGNVAVLIAERISNENNEICQYCNNHFTMNPFRFLELQTVFCPYCDTVLKKKGISF